MLRPNLQRNLQRKFANRARNVIWVYSMKERGSKKKERQKQGAKSLLARMRPLKPDDPEEAHRIKAEVEKIA